DSAIGSMPRRSGALSHDGFCHQPSMRGVMLGLSRCSSPPQRDRVCLLRRGCLPLAWHVRYFGGSCSDPKPVASACRKGVRKASDVTLTVSKGTPGTWQGDSGDALTRKG